MIRTVKSTFNHYVRYKMKINDALTPDENILALVSLSNPNLKDGVSVGEVVVLDGEGPNNSTVTITPLIDGVYSNSPAKDVNYTRCVISDYVDSVTPIVVPAELETTIEEYVVQEALKHPTSAHYFESIIDEESLTVFITPTAAASKLILGDVTVSYTVETVDS